GRSAGENDAFGMERTDFFERDGAGTDLAIHTRLAHAARDELCHLTAEIENEYLFVRCHLAPVVLQKICPLWWPHHNVRLNVSNKFFFPFNSLDAAWRLWISALQTRNKVEKTRSSRTFRRC